MKLFSKSFKIGTKVRILGQWYSVIEISEGRRWIKVNGIAGSFQRGHIEKYSNSTPDAARKADEKARKEALGLVRYPVWVPNTQEAKQAIKEFANSLRE